MPQRTTAAAQQPLATVAEALGALKALGPQHAIFNPVGPKSKRKDADTLCTFFQRSKLKPLCELLGEDLRPDGYTPDYV